MRRWLFNLAAAVSLVLCVATAVLWVRSKWIGERVFRAAPESWAELQSRDGLLRFLYYEYPSEPPLRWEYQEWKHPENSSVYARASWQDHWQFLGFAITRAKNGEKYARVIVPFWMMVLSGTLAPLIWIWRTGRRARPGSCPTCGYDLRATPDRCPECGAVPPVPPVPPGGAAV